MTGFFGIGVFHPKHEQNIGTLFRSAVAFGAAFVFTVGRRYRKQSSDTCGTAAQIPLYHYQTVQELVEHMPHGCPLIGIELIDSLGVPLTGYTHNVKACYLLGAEDHGLPLSQCLKCHDLVTIPGASACLNVASAGTIVMYDRYTKRANHGPSDTAGLPAGRQRRAGAVPGPR